MIVARINKHAVLPERQPDSAGYDVFSYGEHTLSPGETKIIPLGFNLALPENHVAFVWDRSGFSKRGLHIFRELIIPEHQMKSLEVVTFGGVIDWSYRNQCGVILHSFTDQIIPIHHGMKIAQILVQEVITDPIQEISLEEYNQLPPIIKTKDFCNCPTSVANDQEICVYCGKAVVK